MALFTVKKRAGISLFFASAFCFGPVDSARGQEPQPDGVLKQPRPIKIERQIVEATLGPGTDAPKFSAIVVGGYSETLAEAKITSIDAEGFTFVTILGTREETRKLAEGKTGQFKYRLPGDRKLPLRVGQVIVLERNTYLSPAFGYRIRVRDSKGGILLSAASIHSQKIADAAVEMMEETEPMSRSAVTFLQDEQKESLKRSSRLSSLYALPVTLSVFSSGRLVEKRSVLEGEVLETEIEKIKYAISVTRSVHSVPAKDSEGVFEGAPFSIEYFVIQSQ